MLVIRVVHSRGLDFVRVAALLLCPVGLVSKSSAVAHAFVLAQAIMEGNNCMHFFCFLNGTGTRIRKTGMNIIRTYKKGKSGRKNSSKIN